MDQLRFVFLVVCFFCFQFHQHFIFDNYICKIITNYSPLVCDIYWFLGFRL